MTAQTLVPCPRCGTATAYTPSNRWRPFCSERCKMIDLGYWASERYRVPDESVVEDDEAVGPQ